MKWFTLLLFVLFFCAGLSPQLRTRYTPLPVARRVWSKVWAMQWQRWGLVVSLVRVG